MSVTPRAVRAALLPAVVVAWLAVAAPVAAHAELATSAPQDGAVLDAPPDQVVGTFTEGLVGDSSMDLLGPGGETIATGGIDPADDERMLIEPASPLAPGEYEVRWRAFAADGHLEIGKFTFTVLEPTPEPTVAPSPTPGASPTVAPTATPEATPAPEPDPEPTAGSEVIIPILAALVALGALGVSLLRRGRRA